jgi:PilZ domain
MVKILERLSVEEQRILARLLKDWKEKDQRRYSRIPCSIITEYRALNRSYKDSIKNISLGGAFIESTNHFHVDMEISQHFFFPNFEIPIRSRSTIIWTAPVGFGVQFEMVEDRQ